MNIDRFANKVRELIKNKHKGDVEAQVQALDEMLAGDGSIVADWKRFEELSKSTMKEITDTIIDKYQEICDREDGDRLYKSACMSGHRMALLTIIATLGLAKAGISPSDSMEEDMGKVQAILIELDESLESITHAALKKMNAAVN